MKKTLREFRAFAVKGNALDLAVGVIIGAAFNAIVTSLVNDVIMPLVSLLTGGFDFTQLFIALDGNTYATLEEAKAAGAAVFSYGSLISAIVNFLIVAWVLFFVTRALLRLRHSREEAAEPAKPAVKQCPYCLSEVPAAATRCPHCTSVLEGSSKTAGAAE